MKVMLRTAQSLCLLHKRLNEKTFTHYRGIYSHTHSTHGLLIKILYGTYIALLRVTFFIASSIAPMTVTNFA